MRSPLTETIRKVEGMITYVRENLSTDEFMLFLDLLVPEPVVETKPAKKTRKKAAGKSRRAASLANQIQARVLDGGVSKMRCAQVSDDGDDPTTCGEYADHNIHHLETMSGYHPFSSTTKDDSYEAQAATGD